MRNIIDSHVHFWDTGHLSYPWLLDVPDLYRAFLPDDLPQSDVGWQMEKLVFVQADCEPQQGLAEAQWVAGLPDDRIAGIVGFAALEKGDAVRADLAALAAVPKVKGVRRLIQSEPLGFCTQAAFIAGVQALADFDLSFDICVLHHQLPDVLALVRQCPNVRFVLDHCGKPDVKNGQLAAWDEHITALAGFDNVYCKLSGLVTEADHANWTLEHLQPFALFVLEAFGPGRVLYGGDWPVLTLAADYPRWLRTAFNLTAHLTQAEQDLVFRANVQEFYGLP